MNQTYHSLEEVVLDPLFPELDHKLRSGYHVDMDDIRHYEFLLQALAFLQSFYRGYQCRLVHGPEGYFYLLSEGELLGRRRLSVAEMLVGQVLALMRMDPAYLKSGGRMPLEHVLSTLEMLLGQERLAELLAPRSRGRDRELEARKIREEVERALNGLARMGFITLFRDSAEVLPRKPLMRFVDLMRATDDFKDALNRLQQTGAAEVVGNHG